MNNEIVVFDPVMAKLAEFKAQNENIVYDVQDPKGNKACRSHIAHLRKFKTRIADVHKEAKASALAYGRRLDEKRREYTAEVEEMIAFQKAPLDAIEAEKQARIDADVKRHAEAEAARLAELEAKEKKLQEIQTKQATEKAEAERIVREKQIAEEATARAKAEAETRAKADAKAAAEAIAEAKAQHKAQSEAAERAKTEEIQRIKDEAEAKERARIQAEQQAKDEEAACIAAEKEKERKRIANKKHREKIENDIHTALTATGQLDNVAASEIIDLIKNNKIPHVTINY